MIKARAARLAKKQLEKQLGIAIVPPAMSGPKVTTNGLFGVFLSLSLPLTL